MASAGEKLGEASTVTRIKPIKRSPSGQALTVRRTPDQGQKRERQHRMKMKVLVNDTGFEDPEKTVVGASTGPSRSILPG